MSDHLPAERPEAPVATTASTAAPAVTLEGMALAPVRDSLTPSVARVALGVVAVLLISLAWTVVFSWYVSFGLLLVPYRLIRRGQRKRKREALMHREQLAAMSQLANR